MQRNAKKVRIAIASPHLPSDRVLKNSDLLGRVAAFCDYQTLSSMHCTAKFFKAGIVAGCKELYKITPAHDDSVRHHYVANIINERESLPVESWKRESIIRLLESKECPHRKLKNYNYFMVNTLLKYYYSLDSLEKIINIYCVSELEKKDPDHRIWGELCKSVENRGFFYPKLKTPLKNVLIKAASFRGIPSHVRGKIYFTLGHYLEVDEDQKKDFLLKANQDESADAILKELSNEILESAIAIDTNQISIDEISKFATKFYEAVKKNHPVACFIMWLGLTKCSIEPSTQMCLVNQIYFPGSQMYFFWKRLLPVVLVLNGRPKEQEYLDIALAANYQMAFRALMDEYSGTGYLEGYITVAQRLFQTLILLDDAIAAELRWHGIPLQISSLNRLAFFASAYERGSFGIEGLDITPFTLRDTPRTMIILVEKNVEKALAISKFIFESFVTLNSSVIDIMLKASGEYIHYLTDYPTLLCVNYPGVPADLKKAESLFHTAAHCVAHARLPGMHNYILKQAARYLEKPELIDQWKAEFPSLYPELEAKVGLR